MTWQIDFSETQNISRAQAIAAMVPASNGDTVALIGDDPALARALSERLTVTVIGRDDLASLNAADLAAIVVSDPLIGADHDDPAGLLAGVEAAAGAVPVLLAVPNSAYLYGRAQPDAPLGERCLSFFDLRHLVTQATDRSIAWHFVAPASGMAVFAEPILRGDHDGAPIAARSHAPNGAAAALKPSNALGWIALIGTADADDLPHASAILTPLSSDHRDPRLSIVSPSVAIGRQRRLAFVIDQPDWAFANIVNNIAPALDGRYDVTRFYISEFEDRRDLLHTLFIENSFDNVHFMWREVLFTHSNSLPHLRHLLTKSGLSPAELAARIAAPVLTTSVYDHLYLKPEEIAARLDAFGLVDGYAVSSAKLMEAYSGQRDLPLPMVETPDAVNFDRFARAREARAAREGRFDDDADLRIGWVGNSLWAQGNDSLGEDPKGYHSIVVPAVERLAAKGYPVALHIADRNVRQRSRDEMVDYYGEIDLLICSSSHEGTPNPILEAMASGVPFVSTDVGLVREVSGPAQHEFILAERSIDAMEQALQSLLDDRARLRVLEQENLARIAAWSWRSKVPAWLRLFAGAEIAHGAGSAARRRAVMNARLSGVVAANEARVAGIAQGRTAGKAAPVAAAAEAGDDRKLDQLRTLARDLERQNADLQRAAFAADAEVQQMRQQDARAAAELARLGEVMAHYESDLAELRRMDANARAELDRLYALQRRGVSGFLRRVLRG